MDCQRASILIMEYIDGDILDIDKKHLLNHIEDCHHCKEEFQLITEAVDLVEDVDEVEPPLEIEENIMKKIDKDRYKANGNHTSLILTLLAIMPIIMGYISYRSIFNNLSIGEVAIVTITRFVNFTVLALPKVLAFINNYLLLIFLGAMSIVSTTIVFMVIVVLWQVRKQLRIEN
ncbi:anti-sigma factor family protein [Dethiothermospora halolimnae]|uniref:anti-sigma factor family protein n=1 Tax=Dethiothermospora halolimnae TaxID=3114390 RepID=UPI003CCBB1FB